MTTTPIAEGSLSQGTKPALTPPNYPAPLPPASQDLKVVEKLPPADSERVAALDRLFSKMSHLKIGAIFHFQDAVSTDEIKGLFANALVRLPRFRQRMIRCESLRATWEEDPSFDLNRHFTETTLEGAPFQQAVLAETNQIKGRPFDLEHPLWFAHVIHQPEGPSAMVLLLHHSIGDGGRVLDALNYAFKESCPEQNTQAVPVPRSGKSLTRVAKTRQAVGQAFRVGSAACSGLFTRADTPSPIHNTNTVQELEIHQFDKPFPLEEMRAMGQKMPEGRATVNDVLLAVLTQGLRRYFIRQGIDEGELKDARITCGMPINLRTQVRSKDGVPRLGNHVGGAWMPLDLSVGNPIEQLSLVNRAMNKVKDGAQAPMVNHLLKGVSMLPPGVFDRAFSRMWDRVSVVVSNLRGPSEAWNLGKHRIENVSAFVEGSADLGVALVVISYAGNINVSLEMDRGAVTDPAALKEDFLAAYRELRDYEPPVEEAVEATSPPDSVCVTD